MNKSQLFDNLRKSYSFFSEYNPFNYMLPPVRYFLELTYRCNLNCNFCFINQDRIRLLIKYNLLLLSVSIDGYGENHDLIRNKK